MRSANHFGLTGGIGSGKSTVATMLRAHGACVVDTDAIAHGLTAPHGAALPALARAFGPDILDAHGALDRTRMRERVFSDETQRAALQAVLHPMIEAEALVQADAAGAHPVVFDIPLLTESARWRQRLHRVLVVDCEPATQVLRVVKRSGWSHAQVMQVIERQAGRAQRLRVADAVIYNDQLTLQALEAEVAHLWRSWVTDGYRTRPQTGEFTVGL
jgi:dephospho-CoA kinase